MAGCCHPKKDWQRRSAKWPAIMQIFDKPKEAEEIADEGGSPSLLGAKCAEFGRMDGMRMGRCFSA